MSLRASGPIPLTDQIHQHLSRRIKDGAWQPDDRLPSERALAEEFGVCRVTVARAVNQMVREGTLRRRRGSGTFVTRKPDTPQPATSDIGLLIPFSRDNYVSHIVKGVSETMSEAGFHLLFHDTMGDWRRESRQLQRLRGRAAGCIVFPAEPTQNGEMYASLAADGVPVVFVDRYSPTFNGDWVVTDNYNAAREAVDRLIAGGRRRIAHITTGETFSTAAQDRRLGYCQALLNAGLPVRPDDVRIVTPPVHPEDRDASVEYAQGVVDVPPLNARAVVRALLARKEPPDAIFCVNDWTTIACLHALFQEGVHVPGDVSVAGFADNDMLAAHLPAPIIAIRQPSVEIGRRAAQLLIARLRDEPGDPQQIYLPATIREVGGAWFQTGGGDGQ